MVEDRLRDLTARGISPNPGVTWHITVDWRLDAYAAIRRFVNKVRAATAVLVF